MALLIGDKTIEEIKRQTGGLVNEHREAVSVLLSKSVKKIKLLTVSIERKGTLNHIVTTIDCVLGRLTDTSSAMVSDIQGSLDFGDKDGNGKPVATGQVEDTGPEEAPAETNGKKANKPYMVQHVDKPDRFWNAKVKKWQEFPGSYYSVDDITQKPLPKKGQWVLWKGISDANRG